VCVEFFKILEGDFDFHLSMWMWITQNTK